MLTFFQGMGVGGGLIIAIGAQNAFILSQGVRRNYPLQTAIICSLSDALLIIVGISGTGVLLATNPQLARLAGWGGALFLVCYGARAFRSALQGSSLESRAQQQLTRSKLLLTTLALTFLNPHVYVDTVLLLGSIGGRLAEADRYLFGAGAITASILWFFSLSLGAGKLAPLFRKPSAWRWLDGCIALVMWGIAISLLQPELRNLL